MKTRKLKRLLPTALALFCLNAMASPRITFLFTNGSKASFALVENFEISFGNELTISSLDVDAVSYSFSKVQKFYFEDDAETGIPKIETSCQSPIFNYADGVLTISGVKSGESIVVISACGSIQKRVQADSKGNASINFTNVAVGVYIISAEKGVSFKLIKK